MRNATRDFWIPVGLASLCVALFFAVALPPTLRDLGTRSLQANSDLQSYFLPKYQFGSDELLRGRVPYWNIYEYGGLPFLATAQAAVLYPPKLVLYALLPATLAHWVFLIGHYLLAATGFVLFARELGLRREAAFVGAVTFLFTVPILAGNYHPTRIANLTWMPFAFLLTTRILKGGGLAPFACLSAVVALQLCAGYPEFTMDMALFIGVYMLVSFVANRPERPRYAALFIVGGAFVLGGLVASLQLLPLVEAGIEAKRTAVASDALTPVNQARSLSLATTLPYAFYLPGLTAFAVLSASSRRGWPALATVLLCVWLINGGGDLLIKLPGFSMIRFPYAFVLVIMFFPAWAAATGCDEFLRAADETNVRRRSVLALCVVAGSAVLAAYYVFRAQSIARGVPVPFHTLPSALLALAGALLLLLAGVFLWKGRQAGTLVVAAGLSLVAAQLSAFPFGAPAAPYARPAAQGEIARLLAGKKVKGRAFSLHDILYGYNVTDRIPSVFGIEESFLPWRFRQIHDRVRMIPFFGFIDLRVLASMHGFLDALDLEYIASKPTDAAVLAGAGFVERTRDATAVLFENPRRMGPAWVSYNVRRLPSDQAVLDRVTAPDFDARAEVVISEDLQQSYPEAGAPRSTGIEIMRRLSPTALTIDVVLPRPGVLVVSETAYPGWHAWVDGKRSHWVRANYVLRGVELGAGRHEVRFEYHSRAVRIGRWLSAGGLLALFACALGSVPAIRRRFSRSAE